MQMKNRIKSLITCGIEVGNGVACQFSPFSKFIIIDFYDGAVEGLACIADSKQVMYFKKAWWDKQQNNRLFDGHIVSCSDVIKCFPEASDLFKKCSENMDWSRSFSEVDKRLVDELVNFVTQAVSKTRLNIFCKDIAGEVFILPADDE